MEKAALILSLMSLIQFVLYLAIILFSVENVTIRNGCPEMFFEGSVVPILETLILTRKVLSHKEYSMDFFDKYFLQIVRYAVVEYNAEC